jgi:competence ComEA-like helix-hairpin-helix protein
MLQTTPQERLALGVTALLLAAGTGVRVVALRDPGAKWEAAAADTLERGGVHAVRARVATRAALDSLAATPLGEGEKLDPNRASAEELQRLPRVGPGLARRIVEWRSRHGAFRTLADLDSLPGVGPTLLAGLAPHLTLPAAPAPAPIPARVTGGRSAAGGAGGAGEPLDLNAAGAAELESLPGIGPALAVRILAWRSAHGRFRAVGELDSVPGVGPALLARLTPRVRVKP